ncbi:hypothetical protein [Brevibacillus laterosporus]|uniref:hypothetical protein n=1 Tax=Brevibacillus laterosporus TaxID=1465 RepID=UPI003D1C0270
MNSIDTVQKKLLDYFHVYVASVLEELDETNIDALLDKRDDPAFSEEWMRVYAEISHIKKMESLPSLYASMEEGLRKIIFLKVLEITSADDLAAYISDDFGLILDSVVLEYRDEWLNGLWNEYQKKRIPQGELQPCKRQIVLEEGY